MKQKRTISATDIAALGRCEYQAMLKHNRAREAPNEETIKARMRGNKTHDQRNEQIGFRMPDPHPQHGIKGKDKRCFVASEIYGPEAWQTETLRNWRDDTLKQSRTGRGIITIYYALSPFIVYVLRKSTRLKSWVQTNLDRFVEAIRRHT